MGDANYAATRLTVSIAAAVLVVIATVVPVASASTSDFPLPDATALLVCGTTCPTPHEADVEVVMSQFITPTHPGQIITPVPVTTPEELWPFTGLMRLIGSVTGDPSLFGPGGGAWPHEPLWKLSGLFDLTYDQSVRAGVADLEKSMAAHGNDYLVISGISQGADVAKVEKGKLLSQYPAGTKAPDIGFLLIGDPNLPNGGLYARFPGLHIPIIDWTFDGPEPTNTPFHTDVITRQYDGIADFPLYPLNLVADLNAVLGFLYVHTHPLDVSLAPDPALSSAHHDAHGDTDYYFFTTEDLPLFAPLRQLGVPEALIDVVEPVFRAIVERGYDRSIPPWQPTPARLIPRHSLAKVTADLVDALQEGFHNARAFMGSRPRPRTPAVSDARRRHRVAIADVSQQTTWTAGTQRMKTVAEWNAADREGTKELNATFAGTPANDLNETASRSTPSGTRQGRPQPSRGAQQTTSGGTSNRPPWRASSRRFNPMTSTEMTRHRRTPSDGSSTPASSSAGNPSGGATNGDTG
ncbi:PE-PPE domain-containing protein [Mycobacterium sp. BK558]|nr:PE-PPE domain-containing protein [Mycobacterium sp. BK558]